METRLLPANLQTFPEKWWDKATSGPGAVLAYLGVQGGVPELAHHSLFCTDDWTTNFDAIFESPTAVPDPASIYVCKPSATDASVAPEGCENLFVLVPVPADPGIGAGGVDGAGSPQVEAIADRAIAMVAAWAGVPDLAERVVVRRTVGSAATYAALLRRGSTWRRLLKGEVGVRAIGSVLLRRGLCMAERRWKALFRPAPEGGSVARRIAAMRRRGAPLRLV